MRVSAIAIALATLLGGCGSKSKSKGSTPAPAPAPAPTPPANPGQPVTSPLKYYNHFPFNNVYTIGIQLGSQSLETVLDTGSSNLLALGDQALCAGCENEYGYDSTYQPSASAKGLQSSWDMSFAPIGSASVVGYSDNLSFGGQTLTNFSFGLVTAEQGIPNIWGIAYQNLASPIGEPQLPLFDALVQNGKLQNEFSLTLCALKKGSSVTLGGYDSAIASQLNQVQWTPLVPYEGELRWYTIGVTRVYIAGAGGAASPWTWQVTSAQSLIVDSGTNPLVIPGEQITPLVAALTAAATKAGANIPTSVWPTSDAEGGFATISDADIAKMPPLSFDVVSAADATKTFTLTVAPETYFQTREDGQRFVGIQPGPASQYILGTVFMENFVVLHDRTGNGRLGFLPNTGLCN